MTTHHVCLSKEDLDLDKYPEVLIEFITETSDGEKIEREVVHAAYVSSSKKDGKYDKVEGRADVDKKKGLSKNDDKLLLKLVQTFTQINF